MYHMSLFVPSKLLVVHVECPGQSLPLLSLSMKAPNSSPRLCHFSNPLKNCWYKPLYISIWSLVKKYSRWTSVSVCACLKESSLTRDPLFCPRKSNNYRVFEKKPNTTGWPWGTTKTASWSQRKITCNLTTGIRKSPLRLLLRAPITCTLQEKWLVAQR